MEWIIIVLIWMLFGVGSATIARSKGEDGGKWFLIGFLFGPFGLLFALFAGGKKCPFCKSSIHRDATKCPRCQSNLGDKFSKPVSLLSIPNDAYKPMSTWKTVLLWVIGIIVLVILVVVNLRK